MSTMEEIDRLRAIKDKAKEVRKLQKQYFETRSLTTLRQSKAAESELDKMLLDYDNNQTSLF